MSPVFGLADPTGDVVGWGVVLASASLIAVAVALSIRFRLGIERGIVWAGLRATVQLLAVGALFKVIFDSNWATTWAWLWTAGMVVMATAVVVRRTDAPVPRLGLAATAAVLLSAGISIGTVFGFGVFPFEPVTLVVVAGITIGNALPAAVLGAKQAVSLVRDRPGEIEALLALGFERREAVRFIAPRAASAAITPQVERTKVVGLVALPGAMTGLLLAGVDPIDAVVVQLLVMLLVLGTVAVSVVTVVTAITQAAVTPRLTLAPWSRYGETEDPSR
jgi:putative ABC transport system permease protein